MAKSKRRGLRLSGKNSIFSHRMTSLKMDPMTGITGNDWESHNQIALTGYWLQHLEVQCLEALLFFLTGG